MKQKSEGVLRQGGRATNLFGYARHGPGENDTHSQMAAITSYGVAPQRIRVDAAPSPSSERTGWKTLLNEIGEGDMLVVTSVDRLGRDLVELIETVDALHRCGAEIIALSHGFDTRETKSRHVYDAFAYIAGLGRGLREERALSGLSRFRKDAPVRGRPVLISDDEVRNAMERINSGTPARVVAEELGVTRQALYKRSNDIKRREQG